MAGERARAVGDVVVTDEDRRAADEVLECLARGEQDQAFKQFVALMGAMKRRRRVAAQQTPGGDRG